MLLKRIFTWWNGQTIRTQLYTWVKGSFVGKDESGNRYYQNKNGTRRWVIFNGVSEASSVASEWHGWLHHTFKEPPTTDPLLRKKWEAGHEANLTGTEKAYQPLGSLKNETPFTRSSYDAWKPE